MDERPLTIEERRKKFAMSLIKVGAALMALALALLFAAYRLAR